MTTPCPFCGSTRNPVGATVCLACSSPLSTKLSAPSLKATLTAPGGRKYNLSTTSPIMIGSRGCAILLPTPGVEAQHARLAPFGGGFAIEPLMGAVLVNGSSMRFLPTLFQKATPALEGNILVVDGPHPEEPDVDWAGLVLRGTFGLVLLPFLCWQPALVIPFLLYGLGQRNRQMPTRYLRVADRSGTQFVVKMKGDPLRGMLSQGDDASFWGHWDGGTLVLDRAWNQNTNSDVLLKPAVQRKRNQSVLALIVGSILLFWILAAITSSRPY